MVRRSIDLRWEHGPGRGIVGLRGPGKACIGRRGFANRLACVLSTEALGQFLVGEQAHDGTGSRFSSLTNTRRNLQLHHQLVKMSGKFEPKVAVTLAPPKDDLISAEELAKANGASTPTPPSTSSSWDRWGSML